MVVAVAAVVAAVVVVVLVVAAVLGTPAYKLARAKVQPGPSHYLPKEKMLGRLYSTCASPVVPHLSTRHAHGCLASEIGRDPAFPTRYDRTEDSSRVTSPDSDTAATRPRSKCDMDKRKPKANP